MTNNSIWFSFNSVEMGSFAMVKRSATTLNGCSKQVILLELDVRQMARTIDGMRKKTNECE